MQTQQLLRKYLRQRHMMQLATVSGGQPWCCTVYYVTDEDLNLYWASWPTRRHSQELMAHSKVAAAIPVQFDKGQTVIGIQIEGQATEVTDIDAIRPVAAAYASRFNRTESWVEEFSSRKTQHRLYKLQPSMFVLFDEVNFPRDPRQEITLLG